jgi:hypothetical protein
LPVLSPTAEQPRPPRQTPVSAQRATVPYAQRNQNGYTYNRKPAPIIARKPLVDVSNEHEWPVANMLLRYFPGTIREG